MGRCVCVKGGGGGGGGGVTWTRRGSNSLVVRTLLLSYKSTNLQFILFILDFGMAALSCVSLIHWCEI